MSDHEDVLRRQAEAEKAHFGHGGSRTLSAAIDAVLAELASLRDKAIRFDLDQAGIEQREREAVELVDLRAEVESLKAACVAENQRIYTLLGDPPREGLTLPQEIRAQYEEQQAELESLRAERVAPDGELWKDRATRVLGNLEAAYRLAERLDAALGTVRELMPRFLDALESDAGIEQRRAAFEAIQDLFEPGAPLAEAGKLGRSEPAPACLCSDIGWRHCQIHQNEGAEPAPAPTERVCRCGLNDPKQQICDKYSPSMQGEWCIDCAHGEECHDRACHEGQR